jgi:hypothetical protein
MGGIDDVLERLVTDLGFRRRLREDPAAALKGYDLNEADVELLASQLDETAGDAGALEQRTSKSALFGILTGLFTTGGPAPQAGGSSHAGGADVLFGEGKVPDDPSGGQPPELASPVEPEQAPRAHQTLSGVQDGTSNTIVLTEASDSGDPPPTVAGAAAPEPAVVDDYQAGSGRDPEEGTSTPKLLESAVHGRAPASGDLAAQVDPVGDIEGTDVGTGYVAEPGTIGDDETASSHQGAGADAEHRAGTPTEDDQGRSAPYLKVQLKDAMVSSVHQEAGDAVPSGADLAARADTVEHIEGTDVQA